MTQQQLQNYLIAKTTDRLTEYLMEDFGLSIEESLRFIYNSDTFQKLSQPENGLFEQSPAYVYELLEKEYKTGVPV